MKLLSALRVPNNSWTFATGIGALAVGVVGTISTGEWNPSPQSPASLVTLIPALLIWLFVVGIDLPVDDLTVFSIASFLPIAITSWFWQRHIRHGRTHAPKKSVVLVCLLVGFVPLYLIDSWSNGMLYREHEDARWMTIQAIVGLIVTVVVFAWNLRRPLLRTCIVFHTTLFAYLAWCAFPYFGETL